MLRTHYVSDLSKEMEGKKVTLCGWVHEIRETAKITFLLLRDGTGIVQVIGKKGEVSDTVMRGMSLQKESVIIVRGTVKANEESKKGFEIIPEEILNMNPISATIPFEVTGKVPAEIDVRLDNRYVDLRRLETAAIFNIESTILGTFASLLQNKGFKQIRTPSIIAESSEGGSDLFEIKYFEHKAYLAQSPQLYKQLAIIGGMDKVFMVMPVFRAEKSNTTSHINEITQMDVEIAFADADDAIKVLAETVKEIVRSVKEHNEADLKTLEIKLDVPEPKIITYKNAIDGLKKNGYAIEYGHDFSKEHEKAIEKVFGEAVIIRDYPVELRAFYSMPKESNPDLTNSFDYIYKGFEICSGAQRIHMPDLLIKSLKKKGLNPKGFEFYITAFRCGAPPHAGWSIGLERFTMALIGAGNIREVTLFPRDRKRLTP